MLKDELQRLKEEWAEAKGGYAGFDMQLKAWKDACEAAQARVAELEQEKEERNKRIRYLLQCVV